MNKYEEKLKTLLGIMKKGYIISSIITAVIVLLYLLTGGISAFSVTDIWGVIIIFLIAGAMGTIICSMRSKSGNLLMGQMEGVIKSFLYALFRINTASPVLLVLCLAKAMLGVIIVLILALFSAIMFPIELLVIYIMFKIEKNGKEVSEGVTKIIDVLIIAVAVIFTFLVIRAVVIGNDNTKEPYTKETIAADTNVDKDFNKNDENSVGATTDEEYDGNVKQIIFTGQEENDKECAEIIAYGDNNEEVWKIQTGSYEATQLNRVGEIGTNKDRYYYFEDGAVIAVERETGKQIWKNNDFIGSCTAHVFADDGTLYLCGGLGPDFFAVDTDGKTKTKINSFDSQYCWPYQMYEDENDIIVVMENIDVDEVSFRVNKKNFTYELIQ